MSDSAVLKQVRNYRYDAVWRCYSIQRGFRWIRGTLENEGRLLAYGASWG